MWSAGISENISPLQLSLQGTRQHLNNFIPELVHAQVRKRQRLYRTLLKLIAQQPVPELPDVLSQGLVNVALSLSP